MTIDTKDTPVQQTKKWIDLRKALFVLSMVGTGLMLYLPLKSILLGPGARTTDYYDHILIIPFMSAMLFYLRKDSVFADVRYLPRFGIPLITCGLGLYVAFFAGLLPLSPNIRTSLLAFSALFLFVGTFVFLFGTKSFQDLSNLNSCFPCLCRLICPIMAFGNFEYVRIQRNHQVFSLHEIPQSKIDIIASHHPSRKKTPSFHRT